MLRLTPLAGALVALALAGPAIAAPRAVTLAVPAAGALVPAAPHADGVAAELTVRGRAARGAGVEVSARCSLSRCATTTTADRRGRWRAGLTIVRRSVRAKLTVRAATVGMPGPAARSSVQPVLPAWAMMPPYIGDTHAPLLTVIGDSLAIGTEWPLRQLLPGWRVTSQGRVGRSLADGMALLAATPPPHRPVVWAFSLFTNDDPRNVAALDAAIRTSLERVGPAGCAVWATIARPRLGGVSYSAANRRLRELAAEPIASERLRIIDWADAVAEHPEWLRRDRVHPTVAGYRARAQMLASVARQCSAAGA